MTRYVYISHSALSHHGILGQKWGKKNGPPYPLDPSDHSAQEKKLNNGRYSQGVTQDRGKKKKESMSDEKKKKIKRAIAIGAGVAGAAALTAGGVYLAKHPETAKAALSGVKDLAVSGAKGIKSSIKISKIKNAGFKKNAQDKVNKSFAKQFNSVSSNIKSAKHKDWKNSMQRKVDRKRAKTGLLKDVSSDSAIANLIENPHLLEANKSKIIQRNGGGTAGQKAYKDLVNQAYGYDSANLRANNYSRDYKSNKGIKGAAKKVWAPVAATAGVIGTVGGVAGKISGGINSVAGLANNKNVRKLYDDLTYDPYREQYQQQNQDQNKKKKRN